MLDDSPSEDLLLVDVGRYTQLSEARERGLVVAAMELPHWVIRDGPGFVLRVEERSRDAVLRELERYEAEHSVRSSESARERPLPKLDPLSLYIGGWLFALCWVAQNLLPAPLLERGGASSVRILEHGEWWRAVTALTLHGDLPHFIANLGTGLLFAAFLIPQLGAGLTWLCVVLTGALGNVLNAGFYRGESHVSIGASTSVFGALGLLVGAEFAARFRSRSTRSRWQLVLPLGAGAALLAYLGTGDQRTDYMAHLWGFAVGIPFGAAATAFDARDRLSRWQQRLCGAVAAALPAASWWWALHGSS